MFVLTALLAVAIVAALVIACLPLRSPPRHRAQVRPDAGPLRPDGRPWPGVAADAETMTARVRTTAPGSG